MVFVPIPNVSQHNVNMRWLGQEVQNTFHVQHESQPTQGMISAVNDVIISWWNTDLAPLISDEVSGVSVIGTDMTEQFGTQFTTPFPANSEGDVVVASLPSGTSLAISWRTGRSGRSYRGRTFHVGLTEGFVEGNEITTTHRDALYLAYTALLTDLATEGTPMVVASRFSNNAPRTTGIATVVTSLVIDTAIDSQRRRLAGRGR